MNQILGFLSGLGGLVVFAGAYYVHQKVRLTRVACVVAAIGGFMLYASATGQWLNRYAAQTAIIAVVAVFIGICVIVADIKGKKKGADRPALFAFFLVPVFIVSFFAALPTVIQQAGNGVERVTNNMSVPK
jgi:hypothetical protein